MPYSCVVVGCRNRRSRETLQAYGFHRFPQDPALQRKWAKRVRRLDNDGNLWLPSASSRICSDHFCPEDYRPPPSNGIHRRILRETAVPSIFPEFYNRCTKAQKGRIASNSANVNRNVESNDNESSQPHETTTDVIEIPNSPMETETENTNRPVLRIQRPFQEWEVTILVQEYLYLYETFQQLQRLARINVDLLYLRTDSMNLPDIKKEVDKVQELIHILMNGKEVYSVEIYDSGTNADGPVENAGDLDFEQNISVRGHEDANEEYENEHFASQGSEVNENNSMQAAEMDGPSTRRTARKRIRKKKHSSSHQAGTNESSALAKTKMTLNDSAHPDESADVCEDETADKNNTCVKGLNERVKNRSELETYFDCLNSDNESYICEFCGKRFKTELSLRRHLMNSLENQTYVCHMCGQELRYRYSWQLHMKRHETRKTIKRLHQCKLCDREFFFKHGLSQHMDLIHFSEHQSELCSICGDTFKCKKKFIQHLKLHGEDGPTEKCEICHKQYTSRAILRQHMRRHEEFDKNGPQKCTVCDKEFMAKDLLRRHMNSHVTDRKFICDICGKTFKTRTRMLTHRRLIHIKGPVECPICGKKISQINMKRHLIMHSGSKPYKCGICHKVYSQNISLKSHQMIMHSELYPHACSTCKRGFKSPRELAMHEKSHVCARTFSCSQCGKSFRSSTAAKIHIKRHNSRHVQSQGCNLVHEDKPYKCSLCKLQFVNTIPYALHVLSTHNTELNHCPICNDGVLFPSFEELELHMKTVHLSKKPFSCEICGESFYTSYKYYTHKLLHKDKNALRCEICGRLYASMVGLNFHRRLKHSPTPLKTYGCHICGKEFNNKPNQVRHIATTHSGVKPFKCSICGFAFSQKSSCKAHLWTHSREKRYPCEKCEKGFNDKRNYTSHMNKFHPEHLTANV